MQHFLYSIRLSAVRRSLIALLCTLCLSVPAHAAVFSAEDGSFSLDLPEGFFLSMHEGAGYEFTHPVFPVRLVARQYDERLFDSPAACLSDAFSRLSAQSEMTSFNWQGFNSVIARFDAAGNRRGWALSVAQPASKRILILLSYTEGSQEDYTPLVLSSLDSVSVDRGVQRAEGPVTAFAYPSKAEKSITLTVGGLRVQTQIGIEDAEANGSLIDREFSVLRLYQAEPSLASVMSAALARYYRLIYRDAYGRLAKAALAIGDAVKKTAPTDRELITALLSWQQNAVYGRNFAGSDFTPLPLALTGAASDCDSRALLLAIILNHLNYGTALFVSPEKSHALLGVDTGTADMQGFSFEAEGKNYIICETTAKVTPGKIAEDMAERSLWFALCFAPDRGGKR